MKHDVCNISIFFFTEIAASWEEWWTYDGISGKFFKETPWKLSFVFYQVITQSV